VQQLLLLKVNVSGARGGGSPIQTAWDARKYLATPLTCVTAQLYSDRADTPVLYALVPALTYSLQAPVSVVKSTGCKQSRLAFFRLSIIVYITQVICFFAQNYLIPHPPLPVERYF